MSEVSKRALRVTLLAAALSFSAPSAAYKGRVVDGRTGMPVEGAYVIGRVEGGGGIVVSSSGCTLAISKSNAKGEFELSGGSSWFGGPFGRGSRPFIFFYKRGYIAANPSPEGDTPWVIIPDTTNVKERIAHLRQIQGWIDCGVPEVKRHRAELVPLYREMIGEGINIATTRTERYQASRLEFWLDVLEVGVETAGERAEARWESERRAR